MKTERVNCKGPEPQPPLPQPAENLSEASSKSTHTDEVQPTDRGSKIQAAVGPIMAEELQKRHNDIEILSQRLADGQGMQERLKSLITAKFYSQAGQLDTSSAALGPRKQPAIHPATRRFLGKQPSQGVRSSAATASTSAAAAGTAAATRAADQSRTAEVRKPVAKAASSTPTTSSTTALLNSNGKRSRSVLPETLEGGRDSKHKFKTAVVFGNVSRYLKPERNGDTDGCKFKWKIYLTLAKRESGNIEDFVERVTFYLHSSYCPNVITVSRAPFELTKRGWGEFIVRADLVFWDTRNPVKSVFHQLKFCTQESKYGVQLKQETEHVIELFREVPVGVPSSSAHPKVGEKRKASDISEEVSHVTIAHSSSPPVKIKKEPEEPEETTKISASEIAAGITSTNASPSNVFKTPLKAKTEPPLSGSPSSPCSSAGSRNSLTIGMTGGISMLSSQGQPLILGTISPPVSQTPPSVNGVTASTVVLSSGGPSAAKGKVFPAGTSSTLTTQTSNQSQPRQISLLHTGPILPSTGAGVTVVLPAARKAGSQNASIRAQTTLPSGRFIINSGNAVLGKASSPVSFASASLASAAVRNMGKQVHLVQQPLTAGNGSPIIQLKPGSKVSLPGSSSTGAGLATASSSAQPSMLVLSSAMGVKQSIPIQFLGPKSVAVASSALNPSLPVVTLVSSTSPASALKPGALAKAVGTQGLVGGAPAVRSSVSSPMESSPVGKANFGRVPVPCGGGGGEGPCLAGESDEVMIDVVSCPADESLVTSNPEAETCRGSSELSEAAAVSSHSSRLSGRVGESSSSGGCSSQSSSQSSECSTVDSGVMVTLAASIFTASPARDVLTGAVSTTVCTTVLSRTVSSTTSYAPTSAAQTVTCSSTAAAKSEASVISNSASADSTKLCMPSQSSHIPSASLHRIAVPGCSSSIGQSNPLTTVLSSLSSSPSPLTCSPHPPKAAHMVVRGSSGAVVSPSSPHQVSTGIPAMLPLKVTAQGLKMVASQPPANIAGKMLTSGTNSALAGPKTIRLTFPVAAYPGLPQAISRTPPTSQNSPSLQPVLANFQGKTFLVRRSQLNLPSVSLSGSHDNLAATALSTPAPSPAVYNGLDSLKLISGTGGSEGSKRILGPLKKGGIMEQVPEVAPLNLADYPCLESLMRASVIAHPLIQDGVDRSLHPYCAFNLEQWNSWRVPKRRAAEWVRACSVVRFVKKMLGLCTVFHGENVWSTRQTMVWCRFQALSPYTQEPCFGKRSAALDVKSLPPQGRLHGPVNIRDLLPPSVAAGRPDLLDACLEDDTVDSDVEMGDYIPGPGAGATVKTEVKKEPADPCRFREALTEEEWFVRDTAQQVNVKLRSVEVDKEVQAPVVERMVFAVMKQFAARMLQQAHSAALTRDTNAGEITARDVGQAASRMQGTEFLASTQLQTEQVEEAESEES